jgi:hypothetical protein
MDNAVQATLASVMLEPVLKPMFASCEELEALVLPAFTQVLSDALQRR